MAHQWRKKSAPSLLCAYSHFSWRKLRAIETDQRRSDGATALLTARRLPGVGLIRIHPRGPGKALEIELLMPVPPQPGCGRKLIIAMRRQSEVRRPEKSSRKDA
jgi:hypothetical protein